MTWTTGQKADATIVAKAVRDPYSNPAKDAIRTWVTRELLAVEPTLVLDLWGGGRSADEMTAAGLPVLSVDDGRGFADHGITKARARRALEIKAEAGGYRAGWGSVAKYAPECDAAWLDFMGHLCGETVRVLRACRHMKALAITLMPDRMAGVANLPLETWATMYRAAIEHHARVKVWQVRRYKREGGQWVLVLLARAVSDATARKVARQRERRGNPEIKARLREQRRVRQADPMRRSIQAAQRRARTVDPIHAARAAELSRVRRLDPVYRAKQAEQNRAWYADPAHLARKAELARQKTAAKRAAARAVPA